MSVLTDGVQSFIPAPAPQHQPSEAMAQTQDSTRKRLLFHCTHMGMKENDVMFGSFAHAHLADLSNAEVEELEALLLNNDMDLFRWVMGQAEVPTEWNTALMKRLQDFTSRQKSGG